MATGPLGRQPDKLDYLSPTQFRFGINQLPKVEFFTTAATIPGINMGEALFATPFKDIPIMGDKITYENYKRVNKNMNQGKKRYPNLKN